jgi:G:T-mismatch repair DNA endonuclease (very short patch repair protein)
VGYQQTWAASRKTKAATGYRSRPEAELANALTAQGVRFLYEQIRLPYSTPSVYIPDFPLPAQGIVIEVKGAFPSDDRAKMLRVKQTHPDLDIRFLFTNPNTRLSRTSRTTYGQWCDKHGFPFAKGPLPPDGWLTHTPTQQQREVFQRILAYGPKKKDQSPHHPLLGDPPLHELGSQGS